MGAGTGRGVMFSGVMATAWVTATLVAVVAGVVGFHVVVRGATFAAHAVPMSAFAGAAGAAVLGVSAIAGLGVVSPLAALGVAWLGRRRRTDVASALVIVVMLGLGALFLSWTAEYSSQVYALLFGELLGVSTQELAATAGLAVLAVAAAAVLHRPLLLTAVLPDVADGRGVSVLAADLWFLLLVAVVTTMAVPVVGTLLMFSLMVGPPAAARAVARSPRATIAASVAIALVTVWSAIALSYVTDWPVGFFVGILGAAWYLAGRAAAALAARRRPGARRQPAALAA